MSRMFKFSALFLLVSCIVWADGGRDDFDILVRIFPGANIDAIAAQYGLDVEHVVVAGSVYGLEVDDPENLATAVKSLQNDVRVEWADFNYISDAPEGVRRTLAVIDTNPTPSEYLDQTVLQRIRAAEAHTISQGSGIIVAVLDTGVDYTHPDLADHILKDGSGNVIGYDFVANDTDPMDERNLIDDDNDVPPLIDEGAGHGTHVAGVIALVAPQAKILPIRVLDSEGAGSSLAIYEGILFALEQGATVINLSLGMSQKSEAIEDAIELAFGSHSSDFEEANVIASAGNNGNSSNHFPAAQGDNMIAVAATDPNDVKAVFSNFSSWIDISAPGVGIYSTYPAYTDANSECTAHPCYATWDGTSMSAPFASGAAALLRALDPDDSPGHVRETIQLGADYIYGINPLYKKKKRLGAGRVNLLNPLLIENDADALLVKKAVYRTLRQKLVIKVERKNEQGDNSIPVLTVQGFGNMQYDPSRNRYTLKVVNVTNPPASVTIFSSEGLILTAHIVPVD